jgi:hypothetical protein
VNVIRILAVSVLLVAGGALAQGKKKQAQPEVPESPLTAADKPKTCDDQCKVMEKLLVDPCKKGAGDNKAALQACTKNAMQVVDACYGSCKEKGRLDKQYILERVKPPPGYKAAKDTAAKSGAKSGQEESHGDGH